MLKIVHVCQEASGNNLYKVTREIKDMHMYTMESTFCLVKHVFPMVCKCYIAPNCCLWMLRFYSWQFIITEDKAQIIESRDP